MIDKLKRPRDASSPAMPLQQQVSKVAVHQADTPADVDQEIDFDTIDFYTIGFYTIDCLYYVK